jgi:hypothetical protein
MGSIIKNKLLKNQNDFVFVIASLPLVSITEFVYRAFHKGDGLSKRLGVESQICTAPSLNDPVLDTRKGQSNKCGIAGQPMRISSSSPLQLTQGMKRSQVSAHLAPVAVGSAVRLICHVVFDGVNQSTWVSSPQ